MSAQGSWGCFQGGRAGGSFIQVGDVYYDPPHWTGPDNIPAQGCHVGNKDTSGETGGCGLGIPTAGDSDGGGWF